jgi:hypothetical protein
MPKVGPKPKSITKDRYNLYKHRLPTSLGPFFGDSDAFLCTAKGQDPETKAFDDDVAIDDTRRRS